MILFELNEYNDFLIEQAAARLDLKNIRKVLDSKKVQLKTDDTYESDFLEPWVQWVSIHTGSSSQSHKIKHLGDVPDLNNKQIWEKLSEINVSSGIWGVMNGSRGSAPNCKFFMPDPWTFSEQAYPKNLNGLLQLPRYLAKNYLNISYLLVLSHLGNFLNFFTKHPRVLFKILLKTPGLMVDLIKYRFSHFVFICFADYLMTLIFLDYKKKYKTEFNILFLNSIAHIQHHYWKNENVEQNAELVYGFKYINEILGEVFIHGDSAIALTNGLSQKNTNAEPKWILYRQNDQEVFLGLAGVPLLRVEPHMTHDAHIFLNNSHDKLKLQKILETATVNGKKLFFVESYNEDPNRLFYRVNFTDEIGKDDTFILGSRTYRFYDHFKSIVVRTGKHIPNGSLFSNDLYINNKIYNHEIYNLILNHYRD